MLKRIATLLALTFGASVASATCYVSSAVTMPIKGANKQVRLSLTWDDENGVSRRIIVYDLQGNRIGATGLGDCSLQPPYSCGMDDDGGRINVVFDNPTVKGKPVDRAVLAPFYGSALVVTPDDENGAFVETLKSRNGKAFALTKSNEGQKYCPPPPANESIGGVQIIDDESMIEEESLPSRAPMPVPLEMRPNSGVPALQ